MIRFRTFWAWLGVLFGLPFAWDNTTVVSVHPLSLALSAAPGLPGFFYDGALSDYYYHSVDSSSTLSGLWIDG
ncbi:MAG TPA: hypothetical protein VLM37_12440 [Fibrobacteraceae bacterium]|nr:hypothetical protein [Fibrobacteraceae bacterium]